MSKRSIQAPASRPKRQIKAPERFVFDKKFGYSDQFQKSIKEQLLKDVDEDWDKDESSVHSSDSEEFSSSEVSNSEGSISSKDELVEDEDEFQGTHDSDLASDEIVDLNNLPSDSDSEEDESDGYEASESD